MLPLLFLLQVASVPSPGESVPLAEVLSRAEAAVRQASVTPGGWSATMETEVSTLGRLEGRIEGATLLEQTSSTVRWSSDGGYEVRRGRFLIQGLESGGPCTVTVSRIGALARRWVVAALVVEAEDLCDGNQSRQQGSTGR